MPLFIKMTVFIRSQISAGLLEIQSAFCQDVTVLDCCMNLLSRSRNATICKHMAQRQLGSSPQKDPSKTWQQHVETCQFAPGLPLFWVDSPNKLLGT